MYQPVPSLKNSSHKPAPRPSELSWPHCMDNQLVLWKFHSLFFFHSITHFHYSSVSQPVVSKIRGCWQLILETSVFPSIYKNYCFFTSSAPTCLPKRNKVAWHPAHARIRSSSTHYDKERSVAKVEVFNRPPSSHGSSTLRLLQMKPYTRLSCQTGFFQGDSLLMARSVTFFFFFFWASATSTINFWPRWCLTKKTHYFHSF